MNEQEKSKADSSKHWHLVSVDGLGRELHNYIFTDGDEVADAFLGMCYELSGQEPNEAMAYAEEVRQYATSWDTGTGVLFHAGILGIVLAACDRSCKLAAIN